MENGTEITLNILATALILTQFFHSRIGEENKKKNKVLNLALGLSIIIFWGTYILQNSENSSQGQKVSTLLQRSIQDSIKIGEFKTTVNEQTTNITELKRKNDSLMIKLSMVEGMLASTDKKVETGFNENKFDLAQIKSKVGTTKRFISEEQKLFLINNLKSIKGFVVPMQSRQNDPDNREYASQLRDIFIAAGVQSWVNSLIGSYANESSLKGIVLIFRDPKKIPKEAEFLYKILLQSKLEVIYRFDSEAESNFLIYIGD